jgi:two-component system, chemotaxis family, sensor kinase CheA
MAIDKTQFLPQFKAETKEHIQKLNDGFIVLEKDPDNTEIFEGLMRDAHSIKGSAAMMDYEEIANVAHKIEDAFDPEKKLFKVQGDMDILFECLDMIESLLEEQVIGKAQGLDHQSVEDLCLRVDNKFTETDLVDVRQEENEITEENQSNNLPSQISEPKKESEKQPEPPEEKAVVLKPTESLRVNLDRLNELMNLSGEMLISKIRLNQLIKTLNTKIQSTSEFCELEDIAIQLTEADEKFSFITSDIQDEVMKLRMIPVSNLFSQFPRAMRDLAHKNQKQIEFDMKGEDTYLDKSIIDQMKDPLMHLLRNAVDHGIEKSVERVRNNKPETGKISLNAYHSGSQVVIEIFDDGQGIDVNKVKEQAIARNIASPEKINQMTDEKVFQFIFMPGFSTAAVVTETSGRGVGMDVVKESILKLKGMIEVSSKAGLGTAFTIKLPLTLMITECLLVDCGNDVFGLPIDNIIETARIRSDEIETIGNKEVVTIRDEVIPMARLNNMFSLPCKGIVEKRFFPLIIVQSIKNKLAIQVDQIIGHHELVVKALGYPLRSTKNLSGSAVLGNGKVVLVLDIPSIVDDADYAGFNKPFVGQIKSSAGERMNKILLAEDTLSTAMLEKNILEAAGFAVVVARDGKEALERAAQEKFDLVITDVLMPKMNGYELAASLKKDNFYKNVPVVIVTTRGSDSDKKKGLEAGADAYLLKKDFTSDKLLETINQLITVRN